MSDDSGHANSMSLPAKVGCSKCTRSIYSAFTAPPSLSPLVDCSPMEMPVPEPHPQAGSFLPAESQAPFNEAFGQFLYNMHCLFTTPTMQPLLQQLSNHFGKRADTVGEVSSLSTSSESTSRLPSSQSVVSVVCI